MAPKKEVKEAGPRKTTRSSSAAAAAAKLLSSHVVPSGEGVDEERKDTVAVIEPPSPKKTKANAKKKATTKPPPPAAKKGSLLASKKMISENGQPDARDDGIDDAEAETQPSPVKTHLQRKSRAKSQASTETLPSPGKIHAQKKLSSNSQAPAKNLRPSKKKLSGDGTSQAIEGADDAEDETKVAASKKVKGDTMKKPTAKSEVPARKRPASEIKNTENDDQENVEGTEDESKDQPSHKNVKSKVKKKESTKSDALAKKKPPASKKKASEVDSAQEIEDAQAQDEAEVELSKPSSKRARKTVNKKGTVTTKAAASKKNKSAVNLSEKLEEETVDARLEESAAEDTNVSQKEVVNDRKNEGDEILKVPAIKTDASTEDVSQREGANVNLATDAQPEVETESDTKGLHEAKIEKIEAGISGNRTAPVVKGKKSTEVDLQEENETQAGTLNVNERDQTASPKKLKTGAKRKGIKTEAPAKNSAASKKKKSDDDALREKEHEEEDEEEQVETIEEPSPPVLSSKVIIIEASKECNSFKTRAAKVQEDLKKALSGVEVLLNPDKPRKGCFEIRDKEGNVFISLLKMPRPFKKLKDLDLDALVAEIVSQAKN